MYWLCEDARSIDLDCEHFSSMDGKINEDKVRDHDHLSGKYRVPAYNKCNLNCTQRQSSIAPILVHNFSGYDWHSSFEQFLTESFTQNYIPR